MAAWTGDRSPPIWLMASRRTGEVTVVAVGLGGPRRRRAEVGPADWPVVLGAYQQAVTRIVAEHGGTVIGFEGDLAVACFGRGHPGDGDGRAALSAAMDVVRAVDRLSATLPAPFGAADLRAHVGVHTAAAPAGPGRTAGDPFADLADLAEVAARLRAATGPGEVLASTAVAERFGNLFELSAVPSRAGVAYRVMGRRPARVRPGRRAHTPLVGRVDELGWLDRHWRAVTSGPARSVMVVGDPGIGKSRLLSEFGASVAAGGGRVVILGCRPASDLTPLHPFGPVAAVETPAGAAAWLQAAAGESPVLVVVEDVHWADPSTLEALDLAVADDRPLLLVCSSWPALPSGATGWPRHSARLVLGPLAPGESRELVEAVLGGGRLGTGMVDELADRGDGVPLYLEELARNAAAQEADDPQVVPPSLREAITARLERLGDSGRVARLASVIGREFDPELVRELAGLDAAAMEAHVRDLLAQAVISPDGRPGGTARFRHALIQQAAYQSLAPAERRRAHSSVADALTAAGSDPQLVAHHLTEAARYGEAVAMWRMAARAARSRSRFREAAGHERAILALLPHLEADHRDSVELKARSRLAMCLTAVDQAAPEVLAEATRAQDLARAYGDERTVLDTYLILLPWWQARGDYGAIDAALPEAHLLAGRAGQPSYGYALAMVEASVRIWQGRLPEGLRQLGEMFEHSGVPLRESLRGLPAVSAPAVLMRSSSRVAAALGFWLTGDARSAWRLVDDALAFAEERAVTAAQAVVCATAALIAQLDGDPVRAAGYGVRAEHAPAESATLQWRRWGAALHRWAGRRYGEIQIPGPMLRPYFLMLAAGGDAVADDRAARLLDEAVAGARSSGERFCEAELLRCRARAWAGAGRPDRAAADLLDATAAARSQMARSLELRALTDRALILGEESVRGRLEQLVSSLGVDGPSQSLAAARRALAGP